MIPSLRCERRALGELTADPAAAPWREIAPVEFRDAITGAPPVQRTWLRTAHDGRDWRILFHCEDAHPWATMTARDAPLYKEETVEVFIDPVGDLESYYEIETNPLGAILDLVLRRSRSGYKADTAWDCDNLRTLARIAPGGWFAELSIPFASIAAPPQPGEKWRVNFSRIDRPVRDESAPRELTAWSPPMRGNFHTPERFGSVEFQPRPL